MEDEGKAYRVSWMSTFSTAQAGNPTSTQLSQTTSSRFLYWSRERNQIVLVVNLRKTSNSE